MLPQESLRNKINSAISWEEEVQGKEGNSAADRLRVNKQIKKAPGKEIL